MTETVDSRRLELVKAAQEQWISALTDQQLGGGMMWVPGAITYSIAFVAFLFRWLADEESRSKPALAAVEGSRPIGG